MALVQSNDLKNSVCRAIEDARPVNTPFFHLEFEHVFPEEVYSEMLNALPMVADYRRMSGRAKEAGNGHVPTRLKMELLPEYIRHLPENNRPVWHAVGATLCSEELQAAFKRKLASALKRRFGSGFADVDLYPLPLLTRDTSGYNIPPHTDTHWKGITVQFYLPPDASTPHIGTVFHEQLSNGAFSRSAQMSFAPNTGYAFAVGSDTWHSVDQVGPEVKSRDSILLTYLVDEGMFRFLRNRVRRTANMLRNEWRHRGRN